MKFDGQYDSFIVPAVLIGAVYLLLMGLFFLWVRVRIPESGDLYAVAMLSFAMLVSLAFVVDFYFDIKQFYASVNSDWTILEQIDFKRFSQCTDSTYFDAIQRGYPQFRDTVANASWVFHGLRVYLYLIWVSLLGSVYAIMKACRCCGL